MSTEKQTTEQPAELELVLVYDQILGSKYELQEVKAIDAVELISNILNSEITKETKE